METSTRQHQPSHDPTSTTTTKRPRDHRLIHLVLASQGVTAHQDRVPLQLLDFAYRYTAGVLSDALALSAEGYGGTSTAHPSRARANASSSAAANNAGGGAADEGSITLPAMKLAIASRMQYQFNAALPKEFQMELAAERNKIALPRVEREFGLRLPPERYCFTGVGWGMKEEWESEGEEDVPVEDAQQGKVEGGDEVMGEDGDEDAVDQEEFEEAMGIPGDGGGANEDAEMTGS